MHIDKEALRMRAAGSLNDLRVLRSLKTAAFHGRDWNKALALANACNLIRKRADIDLQQLRTEEGR